MKLEGALVSLMNQSKPHFKKDTESLLTVDVYQHPDDLAIIHMSALFRDGSLIESSYKAPEALTPQMASDVKQMAYFMLGKMSGIRIGLLVNSNEKLSEVRYEDLPCH